MQTVKFSLMPGLFASLFYLGMVMNSAKCAQEEVPRKIDDEILTRFVDECVSIAPGEAEFPNVFQMGGLDGGPFSRAPRPIAMPMKFRISRYEVTQELYETVTGVNPSRWKGSRNSVEMVCFQDAEKFCSRLTVLLQTRKMIAPNEAVRLPTEAEWEYCCRAGTQTRYSFGDSATAAGDQNPQATILNDYAWHTGNAAGNDPVVGSLKPNPWGLYDMHGYLSEFVADSYAPESGGPPSKEGSDNELQQKDKSVADNSAARIVRGGSWRDDYSMLTSAYRLTLPNHAASDAIGFRCVIADVPQSK